MLNIQHGLTSREEREETLIKTLQLVVLYCIPSLTRPELTSATVVLSFSDKNTDLNFFL